MKRFTGITIVAVLGLLVLGCLPVPLGDPEKASVDPKLVGAWSWADAGQTNVVILRPWDAHTYVADIMCYTGDTSAPVPKYREVYKAWLTPVKGQQMITLQPIALVGAAPEKRTKGYMIARVSVDGDTLTATGLDGGYAGFADVATATQMEKLVTEKFDDVSMWAKPIVATKLLNGSNLDLDKLAKSFENR